MKVRDLAIIAGLASILFVVEQALSIIPNVQLTFLIIIIYSKKLHTRNTLCIIFIHVLLDNLFIGTLSLIYLPIMFIGYALVPITLYFIKTENEISLALLSIVYSAIYCMLFVIPSCLLTGIKPIDYLIADIPFMIILSISSFVSVLWLYNPVSNKLTKLIEKNNV